MHPKLTEACNALREMATLVLQHESDKNLLSRRHGWHHPSVSATDLAEIPSTLARRLEAAGTDVLEGDLLDLVSSIPARMTAMREMQTVQHCFNGHGHQGIPAFTETFSVIERRLGPLLDWKSAESNQLPPALIRKLTALRRALEAIETQKGDVAAKVKAINDAHAAAEALPETLTSLQQTRNEIEEIKGRCSGLEGEIAKVFDRTSASEKKTATELDAAQKLRTTISEIEKQCSEVLGGVTAHGLAFSFEASARRLRIALALWVVGLIGALGVGGWFGATRIGSVSHLLERTPVEWAAVIIELTLSLLSIAGPIWFAWLATKQIGQNFRLAEDYAFKAAASKAYEGFRRQCANSQNAEFSEQLLASTLTRFDEPPLRWVSQESHGSPWHEFLHSDVLQNALNKIPELNKAYQDAARKIVRKRKPISDAAAVLSPEAPAASRLEGENR